MTTMDGTFLSGVFRRTLETIAQRELKNHVDNRPQDSTVSASNDGMHSVCLSADYECAGK